MSINEGSKSPRVVKRKPNPDDLNSLETIDVASYIASIIKGIRGLTRRPTHKDLNFLDQLLAIAEEEASILASRIYH